MRVAVYYVPEPGDPLWQSGTRWLGSDPETAETLPQPAIDGIAPATASPRRYGFHATLKPPMALRHGLDPFLNDASALARTLAPFPLPALSVARLDGFIALTCPEPTQALQSLADTCVAALDRHRAPESLAQMTRRANGLDETAATHLARWGYPYVFDRWQFHMTLTERLPIPHRLEDAARRHFAIALAQPRLVTSLAIFAEPEPGAAFQLAARLPFGSRFGSR